MSLTLKRMFLAACLLAISTSSWGQDKKQAFLDAKDAGPDFAVQGEYVGKLGDQAVGVQVIAKGGGKFDGVVFPNGLPGAGWDAEKKVKHKISGATKDGSTVLSGGDIEATITGDNLALKQGTTRGELKKVLRASPTVGAKAPEGAIILFDGTNVDKWNPGKLDGNLMGVGTRTKEVFENYTLHLEFRTPFMPFATGQGRGNSGMYLGDQYECQVLDSFGLEGADNECGGIYSNSKPKLNMCLPPLTWQTYDVDFTCAKFDGDKVVAPAKVTIKHNGVIVHENLELKTTPGGSRSDQKPGGLFLQDHGDPVRFRNIWLVPKK
ncbi:MAG: DUF1080 domain-containing protein [Planctomycetaceae bacterium]